MRASLEYSLEVAAVSQLKSPAIRRFVIAFALVEAILIGGAVLTHVLR
jgi:hypothetical protein